MAGRSHLRINLGWIGQEKMKLNMTHGGLSTIIENLVHS